MKNNLNIVCIIPARGGSKGIPKKNIIDVAGKPLVAWSIEQALKSKYLNNNVFVSSDCDEILDISKSVKSCSNTTCPVCVFFRFILISLPS